jgi:hypothetical protein
MTRQVLASMPSASQADLHAIGNSARTDWLRVSGFGFGFRVSGFGFRALGFGLDLDDMRRVRGFGLYLHHISKSARTDGRVRNDNPRNHRRCADPQTRRPSCLLAFTLQALGFRVWGFGFRIWGLGFIES